MHIGKKGFTLVEIIVSLAIMSIVAGAIGAFVIAGNNSYMRGNRELTLQEEAQLTANQLIDLIIDVERGISFQPTTGDAVNVDGGVEANGVPAAELILRNNDNVYMVRWQGGSGYDSANQLYLYEAVNGGKDADGNIIWGDPAAATPSLMAEYVTAFNIDLRDLDKRKVKLEMTFSYQDKTYNISETIKLRNDLSGEESTDYAWITGLTIDPTSVPLNQGAVQNFTYKLTGDEAAVAKGVTWKVTKADGSTCKSNIDGKGKLTIASDEDPGDNVLLVTCTAVADPSKVATAVVSVKRVTITSLTISPQNPEVKRGGQLQFTYTMEGDESAIAQGVEWSLSYADDSNTTASSIDINTGLLSVGDMENIGTRVLKVTCVAKADRSKSDYTYVTVSAVSGQYNAEIVVNKIVPYAVDEDGNEIISNNDDEEILGRIGYWIDLECYTAWADYNNEYPKITWEVISPISGYHFEDVDASDPYGQYKKKLYCEKNVDMTIKVRANVQLSATDWVYPEREIVIPGGSTAKDEYNYGTNKDPYISSKQLVLFRNDKVTCKLEEYDGDYSKVTWEIVNDVEEGLAYANPEKEQWGEAELGMSRRVGFARGSRLTSWDGSVVPKEVIGTTQDAYANTNNLYPTATGQEVSIFAKWYINWNEEHILTVRASDENGTIAETKVLLPRCEIAFSNGNRYFNIDKRKYPHGWYTGTDPYTGKNNKLYLQMYGFTFGSGAFGAAGGSNSNQSLPMVITLEGENEFKSGTYINGGSGSGVRSEDGKKCTTWQNTPSDLPDDDGKAQYDENGNKLYAYQVHLYVDGNEGPEEVKDSEGNVIGTVPGTGNDTLYLKFADSASATSTDPDAVKMNERVTIIYWR